MWTAGALAQSKSALAIPRTAILTAIADGTLFSESGDIDFGADDGVFVGVTANAGGFAECRALLQFDLTSVPANAVRESASLFLVVNRSVNAGAVNVTLHRLRAE